MYALIHDLKEVTKCLNCMIFVIRRLLLHFKGFFYICLNFLFFLFINVAKSLKRIIFVSVLVLP